MGFLVWKYHLAILSKTTLHTFIQSWSRKIGNQLLKINKHFVCPCCLVYIVYVHMNIPTYLLSMELKYALSLKFISQSSINFMKLSFWPICRFSWKVPFKVRLPCILKRLLENCILFEIGETEIYNTGLGHSVFCWLWSISLSWNV
jgi:hypothetical protein